MSWESSIPSADVSSIFEFEVLFKIAIKFNNLARQIWAVRAAPAYYSKLRFNAIKICDNSAGWGLIQAISITSDSKFIRDGTE